MSKSSSLLISSFTGDWKYLLVLTAELVLDLEDEVCPSARFEDDRGLGLTFLSSFSSFSAMTLSASFFFALGFAALLLAFSSCFGFFVSAAVFLALSALRHAFCELFKTVCKDV